MDCLTAHEEMTIQDNNARAGKSEIEDQAVEAQRIEPTSRPLSNLILAAILRLRQSFRLRSVYPVSDRIAAQRPVVKVEPASDNKKSLGHRFHAPDEKDRCKSLRQVLYR